MDPITRVVQRYGPAVVPVHADVNVDQEGWWHLESHEGSCSGEAVRSAVGEVTPWCKDCAWQVLSINEEGLDLYAIGNIGRVQEQLHAPAPSVGEELAEAVKLLQHDLEALERSPLPCSVAELVSADVQAGEELLTAMQDRLRSEESRRWVHEHVSRLRGGEVDDFDESPTLVALTPGRGRHAETLARIVEAGALRAGDVVVTVVPRIVADHLVETGRTLGYRHVQTVTLGGDEDAAVLEAAAHLHTNPEEAPRSPTQSLRKALEAARRA